MAATRNVCRLSPVLILLTACTLSAAGELEPLLETIRAVGPKGAGNRQASRAWDELARADAEELPVILAGLDDAGPLAANWIRTAVDTIADRRLQQGGRLPAEELERFVLDRRHAPKARRLAYEWLLRVDGSAPERLLDGMLDDPSLELRRDAVARRIEQGNALEKTQRSRAVDIYQETLSAARDLDQINLLAGRLRKLGLKVDLPRHFGFLVRWKVIGPFDNTDEKGFDTVYPPERQIDLQAACRGKHAEIRWIDHAVGHDYGRVDMNRVLGEEKLVVGYALAQFVSEDRREAELRAGSDNALKIWLNHRLVYSRNVYHTGSQMDQHTCRVVLQPGSNVILVKVCQNKILEEWGRPWGFQLRVCDSKGTAILSTDRREQSSGR